MPTPALGLAVLAVGLMGPLGFLAAALGTTLAGWAMVALLWAGSRGMGEAARPDARMLRALPRLGLATGVMAVFLWLLAGWLAPWLATGGARYLALALLVIGGGAVYAGAAFATGAITTESLRSAMQRGGK